MEGKGEEGSGSAWPTTCGPFYVRVRQRRLDTLATTCGPLLADPGRARASGCTFKVSAQPMAVPHHFGFRDPYGAHAEARPQGAPAAV